MEILILRPQDISYGIMDAYAENFGKYLVDAGIEVKYFDIKKEHPKQLAQYLQKSYMAVIDVYSGLLSVKIGDEGEYFWNYVNAPIYQVCVDFPIYIMDKMEAKLHNYYALCLDRYYCDVIKDYMSNIKDAYFFPPVGIEGNRKISWEERKREVVFIGTYSNYREWLLELEQQEAGIKKIGYLYFKTMCEHTELNQLQAFEMTLNKMDIQLEKEEFYQWFRMIDGIALAAVAFQRERLIEVLLQGGITVEVFGDSWKHSPFVDNRNLIIHEQIREQDYVSILEDTKISLNIMYCNKAGYSERYSYSMLNGAICLSDTAEYLEEEFKDGTEIVFYKLGELEKLPQIVRGILDNPQKACAISAAAYEKAQKRHCWKARVKQFLEILNSDVKKY